MNQHGFCRRAVSETAKGLKLKVRNLQTAQVNSSRWDVYYGGKVGSFDGCCKWAAILGYLDELSSKQTEQGG